ncbi:hypothetical protein [Halomonas sp.]|uniref:hypothetical protein n=1 Tax=Halomonas sp. TaxID=1486246 RepID=UPI003569BECD
MANENSVIAFYHHSNGTQDIFWADPDPRGDRQAGSRMNSPRASVRRHLLPPSR